MIFNTNLPALITFLKPKKNSSYDVKGVKYQRAIRPFLVKLVFPVNCLALFPRKLSLVYNK